MNLTDIQFVPNEMHLHFQPFRETEGGRRSNFSAVLEEIEILGGGK